MTMQSSCVYVVDDDNAVRNSLQLLFKSAVLRHID